ncbi:hypothetical protein NL520_28190, partial [Klebsiella pneumoniae]|nr:hypothetical protein [Klebsiella pneumoniae]
LREQIAARVTRGKLECRVGLNQVDSAAPTLELNQAFLSRLLEVSREVQKQNGDNKGLSVGELMRWPGVLKSNELAPEVLHQL